MNLIRNVILIANQNIRKWSTNYKVWFVAIYIIIVNIYICQNLTTACLDTNMKISQWILPHLLSSYLIALIWLLVPLVVLFCDAPFLDDTQPYILIRSNRKVWAMGQVLYIVIASFLYAIYMFIASVIANIANITFTLGWGEFIDNTLANSWLSKNINGYFFIDDFIFKHFEGYQATWFSIMYLWLGAIFVGLTMFLVNSITNSKIFGVAVAGVEVVLVNLAYYDMLFMRYVPLAWVNLANVAVTNNDEYCPSFTYTMIAYAVIFIVLLTAIFIHNRKRTIEVLPPV